MDVAARIASRLVGHQLLQIEQSDHDWLFRFANSVGLRVTCPWRIIPAALSTDVRASARSD